MTRILHLGPIAGIVAFMVLGKISHFDLTIMRPACLVIVAANGIPIYYLKRNHMASPIHKAMVGFIVLAALAFWTWPAGAGRLIARYPASAFYTILFIIAVGPPLIGREVFTLFFARKTTPEPYWQTDIFIRINHHLTLFWALLFLVSLLLGVVPGVLKIGSPFYQVLLEGLLPAALMLGVGLPLNKRYPKYYQRKMGLTPLGEEAQDQIQEERFQAKRSEQVHRDRNLTDTKKEKKKMYEKPTIVAVNGSPHAGLGNTSMMIEMVRHPLSQEGFDLEVIHLADHDIEYCKGCAFCLEKGECWIEDDHRRIVHKLLAADGVILASPVYFFHVTAQMKTFIDRSLAFGHKPQPSWKPGLAISVSAGLGETQTAQYLGTVLRPFGAYPVGTLTALAVGPGEFVGRELVEARAKDLAHDLGRAIGEKRRYPATDLDLRYYQFMSNLVISRKGGVMKHDYKHWQEHGLFDGFESYIQQTTTKAPYDEKLRDAWIKEMITRQKEKKEAKNAKTIEGRSTSGPKAARSCQELLQMMPMGFDPEEAQGLAAVYQFEIGEEENFVAHLRIEHGTCAYHEGPADNPSVVVKAPAHVWLAISKGEMDGQQAFMSGRYKVQGDLSLLLRLNRLFHR